MAPQGGARGFALRLVELPIVIAIGPLAQRLEPAAGHVRAWPSRSALGALLALQSLEPRAQPLHFAAQLRDLVHGIVGGAWSTFPRALEPRTTLLRRAP